MNESSVFQGVTIYISGEPDKKVLDVFKNGKGQISKFTMEKTTHVLCGKNYEESHIQEARELYVIPVVTEQWIMSSARLNKLAPVKAYGPKSQEKLFNNFIFTMSQVDQPDRLKLYAMITYNGGIVQKDLDNKVTHLISGGAQSVALKVAGLTKMTIITPDWVLECLKNEKLIDPEMFHPSLLISPVKQQKIIMPGTPGDLKSSSIMRNQLQQNVRPPRPVIQMQHTPQQINEIIQSQIQQQQMQEQAKLRAAQQAAANQGGQPTQINISNVQNTQVSNPDNNNVQGQSQPQTPTILQVNQIQKVNTTQQNTVQQQSQPPQTQNISATQISSSPNVCIIQPNQNTQNVQNVQNVQQMNVNLQNNPAVQQRQITLQQQLEANTRIQKIQLISQQLQQSTQNQQQILAQQQQMKQFQQNNQTIPGNNNQTQIQTQPSQPQNQQQIVVNQQQFITTVQQNQNTGNIIHQAAQVGGNMSLNQVGGNMVQQNQMINIQPQQQGTQPFTNQTMKQILTTNQPQNQQFIINQNPNQNIKTITSTSQAGGQQQTGGNYIQIIQQGQPIIQIQQNSENNQIHQKTLQPTQQIQVNQQIPNAQNVTMQQNIPTPINQNISGNVQQQAPQISSSPQQIHPQQPQPTQQTGLIQNQGGRQNIVIINQLQNPQNVNQMTLQNQRFQAPQAQFQKTQIGTQQIIQQKLLTTSDGSIVPQHHQPGQPSQIIQVHQTTLPAQIQQQNVEGIMMDQKIHNVQAPPQTHSQLTQAQAVQQIAQQLQSAEILSQQNQPPQTSQMTQIQNNPQMNIISNQGGTHQVVQSITQPVANQPQTQRWISQSPTTQQAPQTQPQNQPTTPQSPIVQQTVVQQHIITTNQQGAPGQQFIRATGSRLGPIYLDAQSSLQFQRMDPTQRQEYLEQLHNKQQREGVMFQQRAAAPNTVTAGPRHIVIRSQVPPGLTPQQQIQWISNQRRPILIRQPNQVGMTQINQPVPNQIHNTNIAQIDPNVTPQQQQLQRQHFQRLQQMQQAQPKMPGNVQTPVSPRAAGAGFPANEPILEGLPQQMAPTDVNGVSSNKTKTALANMLSNRLGGNNGNVVPIVEQTVVDQSASGTLRMMTAQHALNVQGMAPAVVRNPQELIVLQQQNQQQIQPQMAAGQNIVQTHTQLQQRRTLGNITNAQGGVVGGGVVPTSPVIVGNQLQPGTQVIMPQSPSTTMKAQPPFSPGRAPPPQIVNRPQFYGHNPNLKLPPELCLLGCYFLIVEYDETNAEDLIDWKKSIKHHGGEIESCYNLKVTHVLCRTQKHGIVMQAIRDNKRCITAYWLNDIILKKQVIPPWQAIHLPSSAVFGSMKPGMKHIITIMGFENEERERVKRMIEESGAKLTTYLNRQNTVMVCKRLDQTNKKYLHAKEFNIPMVNVVWLSDLLLGNTSMISQYDSPKYQQYNLPQPLRIDHTVVPQLMNAWKAPINLTQEAHEKLKRNQMEPPVKKIKRMRTIPLLETIPDEIMCLRQPDANEIPIIMFSNVDNIEGLTRAVIILGGRVTQDHNEMTHLVMTKPNRTLKFLYALCNANFILSSTWIEDSAKSGCFQMEENYWIKDLSQTNFKCDIQAVVKSPIRSKLFENRVFYITPSVKPAPSYLRWLVEKSGGKWEHNRRSVMKIHELNQQSPNSYIVVSCPEDLNLLGFKHYVCYVCTSEFILQSIMTQTMDFLKSELQLSR